MTVRGNMNVGVASLRVQNTDVDTHGLTANTGGVINAPAAQWVSVPGSPGERSFIASDPTLAALDGGQLFTTLFRLGKSAYMNLPGIVRLDDCAVACSQKLADAVQASPGHVIWVDGDMRIEGNVVLGSAAEPVVIVATGNIALDAAAIQIFGLLYSQAANWNNAGLGAVTVRGAVVAEGHFVGNGLPAFEYDPAILRTLQVATGSMVRVPGSWRDF